MIKRRIYWMNWLVLCVWLVLAPMALAGEGPDDFTIRIALDKTLVAPGDTLHVSGSGAEVDVAVNLLIVPDPSSGANALAGVEVAPDADGGFSATLSVPETTGTGRYAVRAEQPPGNGALVRQYYWVGICVNECTGETLGSMLPETGGAPPGATSAWFILSGVLVAALTLRGISHAADRA